MSTNATGPDAKFQALLDSLGVTLPKVERGNRPLVSWVRTGNLLYLSGNGPGLPGGRKWDGQVGKEYTVEEGYQAARETGINLLNVARSHLGSLDKVRQVVKVLGMVNSPAGFSQQPSVVHGFSDLMVEIFGDSGRHARSAVGMSGLPGNIPVEIEMILEVED